METKINHKNNYYNIVKIKQVFKIKCKNNN